MYCLSFSAVISVSNKSGLIPLAECLSGKAGLQIVATGGTAKLLRDSGISVRLVFRYIIFWHLSVSTFEKCRRYCGMFSIHVEVWLRLARSYPLVEGTRVHVHDIDICSQEPHCVVFFHRIRIYLLTGHLLLLAL